MTPAQRAEAQRILESLNAGPVRQYSTRDFGRERHKGCLSLVASQNLAPKLLENIRATLSNGMVAFQGTSRWLGDEKHPNSVELVIGAGSSQFDILRHADTADVNGDKDTEAVIRRLEEYDRLCGITIYHAETDTLEFLLVSNPPDLSAFAQDVYKFCPDIVDQGVGSVEALEERMGITGHVYLWWD